MRIKKYLPTVLTCLGVGGVIATVVTTINSTCKATELISSETNESIEEISADVKKQIVCMYSAPFLIGVSTISCIVGSNVLNKRTQASILSAYSLLHASFTEYKAQVKEEFGVEGEKKVRENIAKQKIDETSDKDGGIWFEDCFLGMPFESTIEQVQKAEYELNRTFILRGYVSLYDFYSYLGIPETSMAKMFGWSYDIGVAWGYEWIDFTHEKTMDDKGREIYLISYTFEPVINYI